MALPLNPANGQTATANGITYAYNSTKGAWVRVVGTVTGTSVLAITSSTQSNSTTTGALTVVGGVGVGGAVYIGTASFIAGAQIITTATIGLYAAASAANSTGTTSTFLISNTTTSTSTNTGALQVTGGAGIGGNLNVGGNIVGGGVRNSSTSTAPTNPTVGDIWYNPTTDVIARYTSDGANSYWLDVAGPTVSGLTVQNTAIYANSFNGTSQYLNVANNAALNFGASSFTVEAWVYFSSGVTSQQCIVTTYGGATTGWYLQVISSKLQVGVQGDTTSYTSNATLVARQWYHFAMSGVSGSIKVFINGVLDGTYAGTVVDSSATLQIGRIVTSAYLDGSISNVRVVKGTALYTAAFAVPTVPLTATTNTSLLTCQTIPVVDASTNAFAVTSLGGVGLSLYSAQQTSAALNTNSPIILPDASQFSTANSFGMRNRLINGAMAIDQRNSGASQTITAAAALAYTVDRWYAYSTGANVSGQQVAGTGALQYVYQFTGAASVTAIGFAQRIEAANSYELNGTTVTLSAFLSNSLLSTVTWTAYYANTADTFGTLASPTRTQIATGSWTVTSSLARYTTNIVVPVAATTGIEIVFTVGAQTSGTWRIGAVQLEPGTVATPFERRLYSTELALCQRYYETGSGVANANYTAVYYKVTKRVSGTVVIAGQTGSVTAGPLNSTDKFYAQFSNTTGFGSTTTAEL
jgi:hypothetical protein